MTAPRLVRAAGCVVWRRGEQESEILLVHRPRWQDWSLPKGKLDRGERDYEAAIRETEEETGLKVRLGSRLPDQHYTVAGDIAKVVHYWIARAPKNADVSAYAPNSEIDDLCWVPVSRARTKLTYPRDIDLLDEVDARTLNSSPLLIVRHAKARNRKSWRHADAERPLIAAGKVQAKRLITLFDAYGVKRVVSSDAARCLETMLPYVNSRSVKLTTEPSISEDAVHERKLQRRVERSLESKKSIAICSHRPVLGQIFAALGIEPIALEPGGVVVAHRSQGEVVDVEIYP